MPHTFTYLNLTESTTSGQPPSTLPPPLSPPLPLPLPSQTPLHLTFLFCRTRGGHLLHQQCALCNFLPRPRPCRLQLKQMWHSEANCCIAVGHGRGGWHCGGACYSMLWIICSRASRHMWGHKHKHTHTPRGPCAMPQVPTQLPPCTFRLPHAKWHWHWHCSNCLLCQQRQQH